MYKRHDCIVAATCMRACQKPRARSTCLIQRVVLSPDQALGRLGAEAILEELASRGRARPGGGVRVLTHCNTGSLATAAYGTALGVVRALAKAGALERAYCTETRPYNQGAVFPLLVFPMHCSDCALSLHTTVVVTMTSGVVCLSLKGSSALFWQGKTLSLRTGLDTVLMKPLGVELDTGTGCIMPRWAQDMQSCMHWVA